jgi:chromosome segregation ATPase
MVILYVLNKIYTIGKSNMWTKLIPYLVCLLIGASMSSVWHSYQESKENLKYLEEKAKILNEHKDKINTIEKEKNETISSLLAELERVNATNDTLRDDSQRLQYKLQEASDRLSKGGNNDSCKPTREALAKCYRNLKEGTKLLQESNRVLRDNAVKHDKLVDLVNTYIKETKQNDTADKGRTSP